MTNVVYLNNAGQARIDPEVKAVGRTMVASDPWDEYSVAADSQTAVRSLFACLINALPTDIAIMPSTAFAITLAAHNVKNMRPEKSGSILLLADQMCSAVYPWQDLCACAAGRFFLNIVPRFQGSGNWTDQVLKAIESDENVVVACLPPLHWSDGSSLDLLKISKVCRSRGIMLIVDATQAVGAVSCNVKDFQPALLACSVHKWLRAPSGASLVYVNPHLHDSWEPLDSHGRSRIPGKERKTWDFTKDEMGVDGYPPNFYDDARKFDSGGKPNPILLPMLKTSLEIVTRLDVDLVQNHLEQLMAPFVAWAEQEAGMDIPRPISFHLIGVTPKNLTTDQMNKICLDLANKNIFIAVRCGVFRVSPYIDTTEKDVDELIIALKSAIAASTKRWRWW